MVVYLTYAHKRLRRNGAAKMPAFFFNENGKMWSRNVKCINVNLEEKSIREISAVLKKFGGLQSASVKLWFNPLYMTCN